MQGATICVQTGSTNEVTVAVLSRKFNLGLKTVLFDNVAASRQAFFTGRCDGLITDASALAAVRATQAQNPEDYLIFPASGNSEALTLRCVMATIAGSTSSSSWCRFRSQPKTWASRKQMWTPCSSPRIGASRASRV